MNDEPEDDDGADILDTINNAPYDPAAVAEVCGRTHGQIWAREADPDELARLDRFRKVHGAQVADWPTPTPPRTKAAVMASAIMGDALATDADIRHEWTCLTDSEEELPDDDFVRGFLYGVDDVLSFNDW